MNVYFAGMIGSGKTTLGVRVAAELGLTFVDLDREMDSRLGYSFHKLVAEQGWLAFRQLEYAICRDFAALDNHIVCLGGGTVRYQWNVDVLRSSGVTILLEVSTEELIERVRHADRPRVNAGTTLEADIVKMWTEHAPTYRAAAQLVYRSEGKTIDQEVDELCCVLCTDSRFAALDIAENKRRRFDQLCGA